MDDADHRRAILLVQHGIGAHEFVDDCPTCAENLQNVYLYGVRWVPSTLEDRFVAMTEEIVELAENLVDLTK